MDIAQTQATGMLWLDALRSRWALRRAAGESRWQLAMHMARWFRLFPRQTQWLRSLDAWDTMRQAAHADPRLYERWHRPYISTHFDLEARRRIVGSHYAFLMQHFPARLREHIVRGHGVRMATLRLPDSPPVHLHLRKPYRGDAGELSLLLLTDEKETLACCVLTFDRGDSVLIGSVQGAGHHTPFQATRDFVQGSHGLHPKDLLVSLVRAWAARHGLKRIRAVSATACVAPANQRDGSNNIDAFWREHGGIAGQSGCHELPLSLATVPCAEGPRSRREKQQHREAFRRAACEAFVAALGNPSKPAVSVTDTVAAPAAAARTTSNTHPVRSPERAGVLLAGG